MTAKSKGSTSSVGKATPAIGRIVSVNGSQAVVQLDQSSKGEDDKPIRPEIGTLLKVDTPKSVALGLISGLSVPVPVPGDMDSEIWIAELELVGELVNKPSDGTLSFRRGVTVYPVLGDKVSMATRYELEKTFTSSADTSIAIGTIRQDASIPAMVNVDELLGKHFAILGTTGTGKSCTVALILRTILKDNPEAHMVLLDPHNEYATSFGDKAEVVTPSDLHLPFWLLTFEELVEVLLADKLGHEAEIEILSELIPIAKAQYSSNKTRSSAGGLRKQSADITPTHSIDTPLPYRISDVIALIDERMGRLGNKAEAWPLKQLKMRIEAVSQDPRFAFMFGSLTVQDYMVEVLGRLLRIPVNGKPLTIIELTGLPSEVVNVVVSVLCRMTFDFGLWSEGMVPITLICEEAHRYIPNDPSLGFEPTRRAIARIAKEGRKYGVSLCIVSQRPSELDPTILSQCNTVFAMRMSNDRDQQIVRAAVSDTAGGLLDFLPSLGQREAIAFGDGVRLPTRIRLSELPEEAMPRSRTAKFTEKWRQQIGDQDFLTAIVERWRAAGSPDGFSFNSDDEGGEHEQERRAVAQ